MKLEIAINNAYEHLKSNNIKSALLDSELLMANAINKSREYIILNLNNDISKKDLDNFQNMINQRSEGLETGSPHQSQSQKSDRARSEATSGKSSARVSTRNKEKGTRNKQEGTRMKEQERRNAEEGTRMKEQG